MSESNPNEYHDVAEGVQARSMTDEELAERSVGEAPEEVAAPDDAAVAAAEDVPAPDEAAVAAAEFPE